ncbi:hypothetical protein TUM19329_29400 [Legionella antarctica]|uniref:Lipoprotein n=1 Tax=Legionella antarctica TaxID=2708020 RepID=A0A6F8T7Y8_9GAMM|nr:hypothetical protein [Legionella antarctica]BCA96579.1 hypothetical protein TUM19329_29400 [Legionella antarctica]
MKLKLALLSVSIFYIAACTHTPTVGEKMLNRSDETKKLSLQWTKGEKDIIESKQLEKRRNKLIYSGNKKIAQGKKLISNGENELSKGNKMLDRSHAKLENGKRLQEDSKTQFIEQYSGRLK